MEKARATLLKRIENGYKPLQKTLDKYNITDVEAKPLAVPKKRDNRQNAKNTYQRYSYEISRRNLLYKIANSAYVPLDKTLEKYDFPKDINALHPIVMNRKNPNFVHEEFPPRIPQDGGVVA